jgi:hypothetical protein
MWSRIPLLALVVFALSAAPACSSDSEDGGSGASASGGSSGSGGSGGSSGSGGSGTGVTCDLISTSDVGSTLKITGLGEPEMEDTFGTGQHIVCRYTAGTVASTVTIQYFSNITQDMFNDQRQGFDDTGIPTQDLSGFGDDAFTTEADPGYFGLGVLKGSTGVYISAYASLDDVKALATLILGKL